jgi:transcriptional/translational regulatory protein YebC/TACO1
MGRIFEVRKHVMFARWNRMAKQFARIGKDITIAVRSSGTDPATNPALRRVIQNARALNMPKDKIEAAIKRASGRDATNFEEILYEGYAPHGVAVLVECATDNPTRSRACATCSPRTAATSRRPAASRSSSSAWACSA